MWFNQSYKNKVKVQTLNKIIVGFHIEIRSVRFLCLLVWFIPPLWSFCCFIPAWACIVCISRSCVMYKWVPPVSVWRQVWGYLRKVLKHAWWQDDRTTVKGERRGRERSGKRQGVKKKRRWRGNKCSLKQDFVPLSSKEYYVNNNVWYTALLTWKQPCLSPDS